MVIVLPIVKNRFFQLLLIVLLAILILSKVQTPFSHQELYLEGEKYHLYYSHTQLFVDYKGTQYSLLLEENEKIIDFSVGDIDSDGKDEVLTLVGNKGASYGNKLVIYDLLVNPNGLQIQEIYRNIISIIRPWKIETCEIDNDDEPEIFIAVNKATHYYTGIENRPFFFNFKDGMLVKKWTGSKVRAPFTDLYFADINGNGSDEFIVIEESNDGRFVIAVYYWFGFGFVLQAESDIYDAISSVSVLKSDNDVFLKAKVKEDGKIRFVKLEPSTDKTQNEIYLLKERR